ncbi:uncharacterized protein THITE_2110633 [Thermothielavioides terrestris NRRL 8126]|uniref:polynucleotide adenylyltransferase n=1 Tax=Thermothielavioides terrestris (strain ATCC 38088 / NRRL 8126) TaxID=578455 RepID=G2QU09_THETT|nr:uncharacterized protein THITE_2110633 [Thermothielavioides terrestris NRRL 8126]AEO64470.1 hypothetical protein THITE_2110633 [Thermothielavioides terrestris NRRL 8126]
MPYETSRYPPPGDAYRPPRRNRRSDRRDRDARSRSGPPAPPRDHYAPRPPSPSYPSPPGVDNYRPPESDFTFRVDKPAGVQEADTYRPRSKRETRNDHGDDPRAAKRFRGPSDRSSKHGNAARPFRDNRPGGSGGRWRPFIAAERALLKADHNNTGTEVAFFNTEGGVTYRPLNELSDSDEAEMDISGDEAQASEEPSAKRARLTVAQSASDNNTPKWSNPDPYTALPPETTTQGKKKDVVQMIRKARIQSSQVRTSLPSEAADFISFDADESEASDHDDDHNDEPQSAEAATLSAAAPTPRAQPDLRLPPKPVPVKPTKTPVLLPDPTPSVFGTRKRTHDDEIKMPHTRIKQATKTPVDGGIRSEWLADPELTPTPWMVVDHSQSANMAVWLHKEVVDFYEYIKPRDFEERLRGELVEHLKTFCRKTFKDAEVYPFGSFPSGLYLPTADMDLAFISDSYAKGGVPRYGTKSFLYRFRSQLKNHRIAWEDEIELIVGAKVPLVKFIEHRTGLKVDISFENRTGLTAIETFKAWREQYPGMPALVTLIKHFLLMRGLNEPVNGGIGGFSVICLVVSMLQMMPEVQSGNLDTRHHLGQLLLHFFDLYGNKFNYQTVAISMNPPRYIPKHQVTTFAYKDHNRLSIIDPNNPANDVSGGSSNVSTIMAHFARAHRELTQRMTRLAQDENRKGKSILEVILGGNYSSFEIQRRYLEQLAKEGDRRKDPDHRPARQGSRAAGQQPSNQRAYQERNGGWRGRRRAS